MCGHARARECECVRARVRVRACVRLCMSRARARVHVRNIQEFIAFLPRNLRHVAAGDLLERLGEGGQTADRDYLALNDEGGALTVNVNGMLDAKWGSSFEDVEPGYYTFVNHVPESGWASKDRIWGSTKHSATHEMLTRFQKDLNVSIHDRKYFNIFHAPYGREQGSFLRGDGVWERKACLYDKGFRRLTVSKIETFVQGGHPFVFDAGVRGRFVSVVVMPKQQLADYNPAEMQWLVDLFFADSPSSAEQIYPKTQGIRDLFVLRQLVGKYSVCGRLPNHALARSSP